MLGVEWRRMRRPARPVRAGPVLSRGQEWALSILLGVVLAAAVIFALGTHLRPTAAVLAQAQTENTVKSMVEEIVREQMSERGIGYDTFVSIQRDNRGTITALTTDMAALNQMRSILVEQILQNLDGLSSEQIRVPLGSLLHMDILWGKGPSLRLEVLSAGTVEAEFESEFVSAGVNQTMHQIWLNVRVPLTMLLPGKRIDTQVSTRLCVAETVIVGQVPDTYLHSAR